MNQDLKNLLAERYPSVSAQEKRYAERKGVTIKNYVPTPPAALALAPPPLSGNITPRSASAHGLEQSSWLQTALTKKARAFASVDLVLERRGRKGWIREEGHELSGLLASPHPHLTMQDLLERICMHLEITGNALVHRVKATDGRTLELWPIDPASIKPKRSRNQAWVTQYEFTDAQGYRHTLGADVITHWMYQHPADLHWGLSPLKSAALAVDTDLAAQRWNRSVLSGGAKPAGVVLLDGELDEAQQELAYEMVNAQNGGPQAAQRFMVFGGVKGVESFGWTASEMDFLAGRKFSRDEICAVLGVPSILVSQGQDATYSNMEAAKRHLWEDTLVPLLQDVARTLGASLLKDFGLDAKKYRIVPDLSNVPALRENEGVRVRNLQMQAAAVAQLVKAGSFTPESIAEIVGLPLVTAQQQEAVAALSSLSAPAKKHLELKYGVNVDDLDPAEALALARQLKEQT